MLVQLAATGPHLHFSFYKRGRYVDPLGIKFPSAKPIKSEELESFQLVAEDFLGHLPDWKLADLSLRTKNSIAVTSSID